MFNQTILIGKIDTVKIRSNAKNGQFLVIGVETLDWYRNDGNGNNVPQTTVHHGYYFPKDPQAVYDSLGKGDTVQLIGQYRGSSDGSNVYLHVLKVHFIHVAEKIEST